MKVYSGLVRKLLLIILIDRDGEENIYQINKCIPDVSGCVNLLKQ